MSILTFVFAGVFILLAAAAWLLRAVIRQTSEPLPDAAWLESFTIGRYRPMQRLLSEQDYSYLEANGGSRDVIAQLRAERRRVFRAYLRNMVRDFNRLHRAARMLSLEAETDRSDFAIQLVRMQFTFAWSVQVVQFRLALHSLGLGTVDARGVLRALDQMSAGYMSLTPAGQYSRA